MEPAAIGKMAALLKSVVLEICQLTVPYTLRLALHGKLHVEVDSISLCSIVFEESLYNDVAKEGSFKECPTAHEKKTNFCDGSSKKTESRCQQWSSQNQTRLLKALIAEMLEASYVSSNRRANYCLLGKRASSTVIPVEQHKFETSLQNKHGKYECEICQKEFSFGTNLTRHQRKFHGRPLKRKPKGLVTDAAEKPAPILSVPVPVRAVAKKDVLKARVGVPYTECSRISDNLARDSRDFRALITAQETSQSHSDITCSSQNSLSITQIRNGEICPASQYGDDNESSGDDNGGDSITNGTTDCTKGHCEASGACKFTNSDDIAEDEHKLKLYDMDTNSSVTVNCVMSPGHALTPGSQTVVSRSSTLTSSNLVAASQAQVLANTMMSSQSLVTTPADHCTSLRRLTTSPALTSQVLAPVTSLSSQTLPDQQSGPSAHGLVSMPACLTPQNLPIPPSLSSQKLPNLSLTSQTLSVPPPVTTETLSIPTPATSQSTFVPHMPMSESATIPPLLTSSSSSRLLQELVPLPSTPPQISRYECPVCQQKFPLYRNLGCHLKKKHKMKLLDLEMEGRSEKYETTTQKVGEFQCHLCCHRFTFPSNLRRHLTSYHGHAMRGRKHQKAAKGKANQTGTKKASASFKEATDGGIRKYQCSLCNAAFTFTSNLTRHLKKEHRMMRAESLSLWDQPLNAPQTGKETVCMMRENKTRIVISPKNTKMPESGSDANIQEPSKLMRPLKSSPLCQEAAETSQQKATLPQKSQRKETPPVKSLQTEASSGTCSRKSPSSKYRFSCSVCQASFTFRTNLTRHLKNVHDTVPSMSESHS